MHARAHPSRFAPGGVRFRLAAVPPRSTKNRHGSAEGGRPPVAASKNRDRARESESTRRDSGHLVRATAELQLAADHLRVATEPAQPKLVADDDLESAPR